MLAFSGEALPKSSRWPVSSIPFGQLARTTQAKAEKMFESVTGFHEDEDSDGEVVPMMADELGLADDEVIPCPFELHSSFGQEMMNVFDADVLVLVNPGTGQFLKGVLALHKWAVCVCRSAVQKNLVHAELQKWVKTMNLVSFADKPSKPEDVVQ